MLQAELRDVVVAATDLTALADGLLGPRRGTSRSGTRPCPNPGDTPPVTVFTTRRGRAALEARKETQDQLARLLATTQPNVSRIEHSGEMELSTLRR